MLSRTERQKLCLQNWLKYYGKATVVAATGVGKTRIGLMAIQMLLRQEPNASTLVVVPTQVLKEQWQSQIDEWNLTGVTVEIINTVITKQWHVNLLVQDECHQYASDSFANVFKSVTYDLILCLTATIERLDGKEEIIKKYAPVCDTIPMSEALENGWVAPVKNYLVLLDVDLTEYKKLDREFNANFAFFGWDYYAAMNCLQDWKYRNNYAKQMGVTPKDVIAASASWMRALTARKKFIESHPKKIEICKQILAARKDKKCITFSPTIEDAKKIGCDYILHSKQAKNKNKEILDEFNAKEAASIASSKALDTGVNVKGLSVGIVMNVNSSKVKAVQKTGRVARFEPGKQAEMFTLVIRGTQEIKWFNNSNTTDVIVINENQLSKVLKGEDIEVRPHNNVGDIAYRF